MVGEFFSGGVCQKENGENCSADAVMDGRLTKVKANFLCLCRWATRSKSSFRFELLAYLSVGACRCAFVGLSV